MKPNFVLIKTECCNTDMDSPCRIILQPVDGGELSAPAEFFINPEDAEFCFTISGLDHAFLKEQPTLDESWSEMAKVICRYPVLVSAADGYDTNVLFNALANHAIDFAPITYITAKNICRRGIDSPIYNLDWLAMKILGSEVEEADIPGMAAAWAKLVCIATQDAAEEDLIGFCQHNRIVPGTISPEGIRKSHTIAKKKSIPTPGAGVEVFPDESNPFCGAAVVFTGKLETLTRQEAQTMVVRIGGIAQDRITKDTDFLIVGEQDIRVVGIDGLSGKMKKANEMREKGIPIEILSEKDFLEIMLRP